MAIFWIQGIEQTEELPLRISSTSTNVGSHMAHGMLQAVHCSRWMSAVIGPGLKVLSEFTQTYYKCNQLERHPFSVQRVR